ncbi:DNA-binding transcriptional ArsR family regulator [Elusimicrobium simillimum]|uniref:ArsR/SmtB family transcription factor n=1 Tax=Elusimicrobium simillimum TaxID=3143438 RepID=UPI003C6FA8FC
MKISQVGNIFAALSQESRLKIFRTLVKHGDKGLCAGDISKELKITKNTLSFHLLLLTQAGLLQKRKEGLFLFYSVNFEAIKDIIDFLLVDCCAAEGACTRCNVFDALEEKHRENCHCDHDKEAAAPAKTKKTIKKRK